MTTICAKSELCIFSPAPAQGVIDSAVFTDIHPTSLIDGKSEMIEFLINGSQSEYLDLNDTFIYLKLQVKNRNGSDLTDTSPVTPRNYMLNALFSDVSLSLNDTVIEGGDRLYPYKATIENIFHFAEDTKRIQLEPAGYCVDEAKRKVWIAKSAIYELTGALRSDFFNQPKYLIPNVNVRIKLRRSPESFILSSGNNGQPIIEIKQAVLYVRRVKVHPAVRAGHEFGLLKENAHYPVSRSKMISYTIGKGSLSYFKDNIFSSLRLPKFVVVGFVKARAFVGDYKNDPFNFENFDISSVGLLRDGQAYPYRDIYTPDFENELYTREYFTSIIQNTEHLNTNMNNCVTKDLFCNFGRCIFTFSTTPDLSIGLTQLPRDGNLRLDVKFAKPLPEGINVVIYGLFDGEIQITKDMEILV